MSTKDSFVKFAGIPFVWAVVLGIVGFLTGITSAALSGLGQGMVLAPWIFSFIGFAFGGMAGLIGGSLDLSKTAHAKGVVACTFFLIIALMLASRFYG